MKNEKKDKWKSEVGQVDLLSSSVLVKESDWEYIQSYLNITFPAKA